MSVNLKVGSLNARGMRGEKRYAVFQWVKQNSYDIFFIQETFCTNDFVDKFKRGWQGEIYHCVSDSKHSRGVCILIRKDLRYKLIDKCTLLNGRAILLTIEMGGEVVSFMNIYCPNKAKDRNIFIPEIYSAITSHVTDKNRLIVGGDFNCVNNVNINRVNTNVDDNMNAINTFKSNLNLTDIWRQTHPKSREFTYIDPSKRGRNSRIDFFLCSEALSDRCLLYTSPSPRD